LQDSINEIGEVGGGETSPEVNVGVSEREVFAQAAKLFDPLYLDISEADSVQTKQPLLAHYTAIQTAELVLKSDELWLSNPLLMNDIEEIRFGISRSVELFLKSEEIKHSCGSEERFTKLINLLLFYRDKFINEELLDTYILCLSEHSPDDRDGLLSMWRGYGGNGSGAAIVINTKVFTSFANAPLIIAKVSYGTTAERLDWIRERITQFARILNDANLPDEYLKAAAWAYFERMKLFALFSKHRGFEEEIEWRIAYVRSRDHKKIFDSMFGYHFGPRGIEPKLKLNIGTVANAFGVPFTLLNSIDRIILGPSTGSTMTPPTFLRMLESLGKSELKERVMASSIPFRS
jgi:Protein of unknown function (DUF2971)